ncbi:hypothetical protein TNCV_4259701 [Trichonephila clavipes]|nr:hypothetical protein TNCV_4259701 [Trichonephila clavipes]
MVYDLLENLYWQPRTTAGVSTSQMSTWIRPEEANPNDLEEHLGRVLRSREIEITQECRCVGFNGPDGRQGCVLTRTVESNRGGRLIVMNPWRILFQVVRSALKAGPEEFSGLFFHLTSARKKPPVGKRTRYPGSPFRHSYSHQISTTLVKFNVSLPIC